ncbi:10890_t:CDS:2, partial [Diversispora eburnea]
MDDKCILSDNQVKVTFEASREKFIEIRSQALLLFGFRSRAKEMPDLKSAVKAINPYKSSGFITQEEIMTRKLDNPEYCPIAPVLPSYKPKMSNEIQDLFDSIPITNNTTSECVKHRSFDLSSDAIYEKALPLRMPTQKQLIGSDEEDPSQDICHIDTIISEASIDEKKIPELLISLSSELLIKNKSDIDTLILLLQQKFQ